MTIISSRTAAQIAEEGLVLSTINRSRITICPHTGGVFSRIGAIVACNRVSNSDARTEHEVLAPSTNPKQCRIRGYSR
jgi:hypothetical protein